MSQRPFWTFSIKTMIVLAFDSCIDGVWWSTRHHMQFKEFLCCLGLHKPWSKERKFMRMRRYGGDLAGFLVMSWKFIESVMKYQTYQSETISLLLHFFNAHLPPYALSFIFFPWNRTPSLSLFLLACFPSQSLHSFA